MSDSAPWSVPTATLEGFTPLASLTRVVQIQQGLLAALTMLDAVLLVVFDAMDSELAILVVGGASFLLLIVTLIGLPMWISWHYRAASNLQALGRSPKHEPWAHVVWWFVPFANLILPYRATKDLAQLSEPDDSEGEDEARWVYDNLPIWWGLFIVGNMVNNGTTRLELRGIELPALLSVSGLVLSAASVLLYRRIIGRVSAAQQELFEAHQG